MAKTSYKNEIVRLSQGLFRRLRDKTPWVAVTPVDTALATIDRYKAALEKYRGVALPGGVCPADEVLGPKK